MNLLLTWRRQKIWTSLKKNYLGCLVKGKEPIISILYLRERNKVIKAYTHLIAYLLKLRIMA